MSRLLLPSALVMWAGSTLLLSRQRWFARRPLSDRLRPYTPGGLAAAPRRRAGSPVDGLADVVGPLARDIGARLSRIAGVRDELEIRLQRLHSPLDATEFRVRQLGWSAIALVVGTAVTLALHPPAVLTLLAIVGAPTLVFLAMEQRIVAASDRRKRRLFLELPVVAEQLGMLLCAGFSLGAAVARLAERGQGVSGQDLRRVVTRTQHGVSEVDALREWAATADVDVLTRLVSVLALNREAGDLGRLIADEARSIRRDVQRELVEQIERRSQQVWIPVTVAALVPGAIFIAIPFIEALRAFGAS